MRWDAEARDGEVAADRREARPDGHEEGLHGLAGAVAHERISASTSSRFSSMSSAESASRFRRSSGSVFDGRTLKCQSSKSTEIPSRCETPPSGRSAP